MSTLRRLLLAAALCHVRPVAAAPQGNMPPSPTGLDCTFHEDHWDCITPCATSTTTHWGIATTVTDYASWRSSMNSAYSTPGATFSGSSVPVYTTVGTFGNGVPVTATLYYNSEALSSAGYTITDTVVTVTSCPPTTTPTLPPSPTGSLCSPHGDHWHCEPYPSTTLPSSSAPGTCTPHGDHWHCPPGVPEPTTPPPASGTSSSPGGTCTPHGDHWHCPPGVPEPTTPPPTQTEPPSTTPGQCEPHGDHWHCPPGVTEPTTPPPAHTNPPATTQTGQCEPHGDHWHCPPGVTEPTTPPPTQTVPPGSGQCEPHGDHWHCPSGVPEPTTPPPAASGGAGDGDECEPHGDHWHCPPGVTEPTTPPGGGQNTLTTIVRPSSTTPPSPIVTGGSVSISRSTFPLLVTSVVAVLFASVLYY